MKLFPTWFWLTAGLIVIVFGGAVLFPFLLPSLPWMPSNARDNQNPDRQAEMIAITLEGGRLAPFPKTACNFSIRTEGNLFSRSFRAIFNLPEQDLRKWIEESPGLKDAIIPSTSDIEMRYNIKPGGGANHAEVIVDFKSGTVQVFVEWS